MEDAIIKKRFIKEVLEEEGQRLMKYHGLALRTYLKFHTGETERERDVQVTEGAYISGKLSFRVQAHVRFLDIKKKATRLKEGRIQGRKKRYIFNRVVMQQYNGIAKSIMFGLTDDVAKGIKERLSKK